MDLTNQSAIGSCSLMCRWLSLVLVRSGSFDESVDKEGLVVDKTNFAVDNQFLRIESIISASSLILIAFCMNHSFSISGYKLLYFS